jgi:hypothetical protein
MVDRVSVYEASKRLNISESAVRQRVHRGTLKSGKDENGRLFVEFTERYSQNNQHNDESSGVVSDDSTTLKNDYITALKSQITSLEQDKEALERDKDHLRDESVRKDHIIMSLTQRIPAIEAPAHDASEQRDSVVSDFKDTAKGQVPHEPAGEEIRQSWWRRWFGVSASE